MPKDPKKAGGRPDDDEDAGEERPTSPVPFDPIAFAREILDDDDEPLVPPTGHPAPATAKPQPPPTAKPAPPSQKPDAAGTKPPVDRPLPRFDSPLPGPSAVPARDRDVLKRKATPTGALSLANARAPTVPPPTTRRPEEPGSPLGEPPRRRDGARKPLPRDEIELDVPKPELDTSPPPDGRSPEEHARMTAPRAEGPPTEQEMNDRVSLGDYTGALAIAEKLLELDPSNEAVNECAESCRNVLRQMYTARIGPLDKVPIVMVPRDQLRWLSIDHRAGFVLSLVDGVSSVEMILDVSGMQELDALRILSELAQQRIISFR